MKSEKMDIDNQIYDTKMKQKENKHMKLYLKLWKIIM